MQTSSNGYSSRRRIALALLLAGAAGCAATESTRPLDTRLNEQARSLAMQCYWDHEGERLLAGPMNVYQACRRWADRVVQPSFDSVASRR